MKTYQVTFWYFGLWSFFNIAICPTIITSENSVLKRFTTFPRIMLKSYQERESYSITKVDPNFHTLHQFENELLSKNGSDYVLQPGLRFVTFECKSKYPVHWTVPHPEQINMDTRYALHFTEYRSSISTIGKPHTRAFYACLHFFNDWQYSTSANFTCMAANPKKSSQQSSIYLFRRGSNAIESQGETLDVLVSYNSSSKDEQFVLPCRPALPNLSIKLEKQTENSTSYAEVQLSPNLRFDPKIGFTMSKRLFENKLFGMYRCKVSKNDYPTKESVEDGEDYVYVYINVTNSNLNESKSKEFKTYTSIKGNAEVNMSDGSVVCCSGVPGIRPEMILEHCTIAGDCHIAKKHFPEMIKRIGRKGWRNIYGEGNFGERSDCTSASSQLGTFSTLIYCKGENLELVDFYLPAFHPNAQNVESRMNKTNGLIYYDTANSILTQTMESKVFISVGTLEEGIGPDTQGIYLVGIYDLDELPPNHLPVIHGNAHIQEYDRNHYYEGENLTFTCLALRVFYTSGIQMQLKWRNGTITNLVQPLFFSTVGIFLQGYISQRSRHGEHFHFYFFFNEPIQANLEMESVECYVPQWNSSGWDVRKYDLDIRTPVLPKVETKEESVYFNLMDSDAQILFHVHGGQPAPKTISVFKYDKLIAKSTSKSRIVDDSERISEESVDLQNGFNHESASSESEENDSFNLASIVNVTFIDESTGYSSENSSFVIKITFSNVTHDVQGTYRCVAECINGNVTKDVYVFVSERKNKAAIILLVLAIVLGILLVGIGVWYKVQHKTVRMLRFGIRKLI